MKFIKIKNKALCYYCNLIIMMALLVGFGCRSESRPDNTPKSAVEQPTKPVYIKDLLTNVDKVCFYTYEKMVNDTTAKEETEYTRRIKKMQEGASVADYNSDKCQLPSLSELAKLAKPNLVMSTLDKHGFIFYNHAMLSDQNFNYFFGKCLPPKEPLAKNSRRGTGGGSLGGGGLLGALLLSAAKEVKSPSKAYRVSLGFTGEELPAAVQIQSTDLEEMKSLRETIVANGKKMEQAFQRGNSKDEIYQYEGVYWKLNVGEYRIHLIPEKKLIKEGLFNLALKDFPSELEQDFGKIVQEKPWENYGWEENDLTFATGKNESTKIITFFNVKENDALSVQIVDYKKLALNQKKTEDIYANLLKYGDRMGRTKGWEAISQDSDNLIVSSHEFNNYNRGRFKNSITNWNKTAHIAVTVSSLSGQEKNEATQQQRIDISKKIDSF